VPPISNASARFITSSFLSRLFVAGDVSCEEVPNRQPSWKCSVGFTAQARSNLEMVTSYPERKL
jgi:hypothetical protein